MNYRIERKEAFRILGISEPLEMAEFKEVEEIIPLKFDYQGNMDEWLIIEKIEDVVAGTSIPYNYEKSRF